jgi:hypothetical protein
MLLVVDMPRSAPMLVLLGCVVAEAAAQSFAPLGRPFDVGISSAYDTVRRRLVLFGEDATTWEIEGGELLPRADLAGSPTPPRRMRPAMCFDEARRRVLMFGGQNGPTMATLLADTWAYDGSRWTQLVGGPVPPARIDAAITWDSVRNRVLMVGGQAGGILTDTWEHDGVTWSQRTPAASPGPNSGRMTFDRQRGVAVFVCPSGLTGGTMSTWEWNGANWTLRGNTGPNANSNATLAFDPLRNRTVLAGGVPNDRVWEWDGASWTAIALPQPFLRLNAASWFDPAVGCVAITGGIEYQLLSGGGVQQGVMRADRWHWDGQALTQVLNDSGPRAAFDGTLIPDPPRGRVVHFGGRFPGGLLSGETWAFSGGGWYPVVSPASPSPRALAAGVHDLVLGEGLMFGGFANGTFLGDTWSITGNGWVARSTTGPAPRAAAALAVDVLRGVVVLFGGHVGPAYIASNLRNDTWEWNGSVWTQRVTTVQPSPRFDAAMAFGFQLGRVMLFGGRTDHTVAGQLNDTWMWDGVQWTQLAPATSPPALGLASMSMDLGTGRCTLTGVSGTATNLRQQVWVHDATNWLQVLDEPAPLQNRWFPCVTGRWLDTLVCVGRGAMAAELTFQPGRVALVGAGCGTPASTLLVRSRPRIGTTTGVELVANPGRAALFGLALTSGNVPLGAGCTLWLGPDLISLFHLTDGSGCANQLLPLAADPALRGLDVFAQAAVLEPQSANGLVFTQGLRLTLGD